MTVPLRAHDWRVLCRTGVLRVWWPAGWTSAGALLTLNVGFGAR
jgi:hypothetical protein